MPEHRPELFDEPAGAQEAQKSGAARMRAEPGIAEPNRDGLASIVEHHGGIHLRVNGFATWLGSCLQHAHHGLAPRPS